MSNPTSPFKTIADVKRRNDSSGKHWFSTSSMRFFRSAVESKLLHGRYFVSSEQFVDSEGSADPRLYTVRFVDDEASIETIGDFQGHPTLAAALSAIAALVEVEEADEAIEATRIGTAEDDDVSHLSDADLADDIEFEESEQEAARVHPTAVYHPAHLAALRAERDRRCFG